MKSTENNRNTNGYRYISVTDLCKVYQYVTALKSVSFEVEKGSLFGIIGPDGAGKTTLFNILSTLIVPDSGCVTQAGVDIVRDYMGMRKRIGYMPQRFSLYMDLTVEENIGFFADVFGMESGEREKRYEELIEFSGLKKFTRRRAKALSGGMKQKLALCCSLIHNPEILLLDEPTIGVDPVSRMDFWDILKKISESGTTVMVSTSYMEEADYCEEVAFLYSGEIIAKGKPESLKRDFKKGIYRITNWDKRSYEPDDSQLPKGISEIYRKGPDMIAVINEGYGPDDVSDWFYSRYRKIIPKESQPPDIEDIFIDTINSKGIKDELSD